MKIQTIYSRDIKVTLENYGIYLIFFLILDDHSNLWTAGICILKQSETEQLAC